MTFYTIEIVLFPIFCYTLFDQFADNLGKIKSHVQLRLGGLDLDWASI